MISNVLILLLDFRVPYIFQYKLFQKDRANKEIVPFCFIHFFTFDIF